MALRATNSDEGVRGAGLPACRRLSSRRAERKLGGPEGPTPRMRLQWSGGSATHLMVPRVVALPPPVLAFIAFGGPPGHEDTPWRSVWRAVTLGFHPFASRAS